MQIRGIHHASFAFQDLEQARHFYGTILGLAEVPRPDFGFPGIWFRVSDTQMIHITPGRGQGSASMPLDALIPRDTHVCLWVDDFDQAVADLKRHGIAIYQMERQVTSLKQAWLQDPEGHVLELTGRTCSP